MSEGTQQHPIDRLPDLVLGEVSEPEADRVLAHVGACAACAGAWSELEASAGMLADSVPAEAPPPDVRARLMGRVDVDARRRLSRRRWLPLAGALAGAAAASVLWLTLTASPMPGQRLAALSGPHGMGGNVYMDTSLHRATMQVWRLPRLPSGMVYEVWWNRGDTYMVGGSFGVDKMGDALITLTVPQKWQSATRIAVTVEPAPGTPRPTSGELITGPLAGAATT